MADVEEGVDPQNEGGRLGGGVLGDCCPCIIDVESFLDAPKLSKRTLYFYPYATFLLH